MNVITGWIALALAIALWKFREVKILAKLGIKVIQLAVMALALCAGANLAGSWVGKTAAQVVTLGQANTSTKGVNMGGTLPQALPAIVGIACIGAVLAAVLIAVGQLSGRISMLMLIAAFLLPTVSNYVGGLAGTGSRAFSTLVNQSTMGVLAVSFGTEGGLENRVPRAPGNSGNGGGNQGGNGSVDAGGNGGNGGGR